MKKLNDLHYIFDIILKSAFYNSGCGGDRNVLASLTRFIALCYQFDSGNFSLKEAQRLKESEIQSLYSLQNCIISYCGCYDTIIQVIKFAFNVNPNLESKKIYNDSLKIKWRSTKNQKGLEEMLKELYGTNADVEKFVKKVDKHMCKREPLASLANNLKHGGGLLTESFTTYIPSVSYVNGQVEFCYDSNNKFLGLRGVENLSCFESQWLYPKAINITNVINQLYTQNEYIYKFIKYVWDSLDYNMIQNSQTNFINLKYKNPLLNNGTK